MLKKFSFVALVGLLAVSTMSLAERASASTAEYSAEGNYLLSSALTKLPVGDTVELGTFTSGFNFASSTTSYTATNAAFTLYATTTIGAASSGTGAGQFDASTGNLDSTTAAGKQLYIWVFNSGNPSTATGWAIITDTVDTNWVGPAVGTNTTAIDTSDANVFIPAGALGSRVTDTTAPSGRNFSIEVGLAPEPSTYAMMAVAGCAFFAVYIRNRRRSRVHARF